MRREVVFDGLRFPEGCRWHDGRLWFSDMHTGTLYSADPETADLRIEFAVDARLSGIDWLPDGTLVVSSMLDRRVLRRRPGGEVELHADLSEVTPYPTNDLIVDRAGRIIVGGFGYDLYGGDEQQPGPLIGIDPDGGVRVLADDLVFPNGMVLLTDGRANDGPAPGIAAAAAAKADGVYIFTVGLGATIDREQLRTMASRPGWFYEAATAEDLEGVYQAVAVDLPCPASRYWGRR